jgi:hypothetical protein
MKKILSAIAIISSLLLGGLLLAANSANAYDFDASTGLTTTAEQTGHTKQKLFSDPDNIEKGINSIIGTVLSFLGVLFLVLIIYGGFLWMTARGNDKTVEQAKTIVIDSVIGLAIVSAAYAVSYFVLNVFVSQTMK